MNRSKETRDESAIRYSEEPGTAASRALRRLAPREFAERLLATRGQVSKERRVVTILFPDVKGSTASG